MKLTQDQIKDIDKFLIRSEVKYWDIRLELTDHFANAIEEKMEEGLSYDESFLEVHKSFGNKVSKYVLAKDFSGWNKDDSIYVDNFGYKKLIEKKQKELQKQYNKRMLGSIKEWLQSPSKLLLLGLLSVLVYIILSNFSGKINYLITAVLVFSSTLWIWGHQLFKTNKKHRKSVYFRQAIVISLNGFWISYLVLQSHYYFSFEIEDYPVWLLLMVIVIGSLFQAASYVLYKNELQKCNDVLSKMKLLK